MEEDLTEFEKTGSLYQAGVDKQDSTYMQDMGHGFESLKHAFIDFKQMIMRLKEGERGLKDMAGPGITCNFALKSVLTQVHFRL